MYPKYDTAFLYSGFLKRLKFFSKSGRLCAPVCCGNITFIEYSRNADLTDKVPFK